MCILGARSFCRCLPEAKAALPLWPWQRQILSSVQVLSFSLPVILIPLADPVRASRCTSLCCTHKQQQPCGVSHESLPVRRLLPCRPSTFYNVLTTSCCAVQIMSLIDAICLGRMTSDTLQLAALGPCSLIFNFSGYVWNALAIATVTLVAERLKGGDSRAASASLSCSLALGAAGGVVVCALLLGAGPALLRATGAEPALLAPALTYLRIRALAAPAAILVQVWKHQRCLPAMRARPPSRQPPRSSCSQV